MLFFVPPRQGQVSVGRLPRLLYEAVQQDHSVLAIDIEQNPSNAIVHEIRANLVDPLTHRPTNRHTDRPAEFNRLDIFSDSLPIVGIGKRFEPGPNRFAARTCAKKDRGESLMLRVLLCSVFERKKIRLFPFTSLFFIFLSLCMCFTEETPSLL
jgi:hypothetical protein